MIPVVASVVPSNVRFALVCNGLVPLPTGIWPAVTEVSPVPPFAIGNAEGNANGEPEAPSAP